MKISLIRENTIVNTDIVLNHYSIQKFKLMGYDIFPSNPFHI